MSAAAPQTPTDGAPRRRSIAFKLGVALGVQAVVASTIAIAAVFSAHRASEILSWAVPSAHQAQSASDALIEVMTLEHDLHRHSAGDDVDMPDASALTACLLRLEESTHTEWETIEDSDDADTELDDVERVSSLTASMKEVHEHLAADVAGSSTAREALQGALTELEGHLRDVQADERAESQTRMGHARAAATALQRATALIGLVMLALTAGGVAFIIRTILRPLKELTIATGIVAAGRFTHRVQVFGMDEFGALAVRFNDMTASLANQQEALEGAQRSVVASRQAGMAEVAACVIHNVGNHLNSVAVSLGRISELTKDVDVATPGRLAQLLAAPAKVATLEATAARNTQVARFLELYAGRLSARRDDIEKETGRVLGLLAQVERTVATQQAHARGASLVEIVDIRTVIEDALSVAGGSTERLGIEVVRRFEDVPTVSTDRHKVLQVLINLIKNAKDALREAKGPRRLTVSLEAIEADRLAIGVSDTGQGIPEANLTRIFRHGFTTKPDGNGFGLHSSALMIQEMGGSLQVKSEGLGHGAIFTVELPTKALQPERAAA